MGEENAEWRKYEKHILERLKEWAGDQAEVKFNQRVKGRFGEELRQVDVLLTNAHFAGEVGDDLSIAVDCKCYTRKVDVPHVDAFIGFVEDVGTDLGLLITNADFSPGARRRARHRGVRLKVVPRILIANIDSLPSYSPAHDEPYYEADYFDHSPYGPVGATIMYWDPGNPEGYTVMPDELQWEFETLASGVDDELSWGDDAARERCVRVVLRHYLGKEPSDEQVEGGVEELADEWQDGYPWTLYVGELRDRLGL